DERARDYTRIGLLDYSTKEREVLELIVLAGEVDLATLLEAGLGEAADALVASGELRLDARGEHRYEAVENHAADTIRSTTPVGRSRAWFDFIESRGDTPSDWAKMIRAEWGLVCGAEISEARMIDAARIATGLGDWHRAMRLLAEVPMERMDPHDLFEIARLYCGCNKLPLGLHLLAHAVRTSCCAQLVIDSLVVAIGLLAAGCTSVLTFAGVLAGLDGLQQAGAVQRGEGVQAPHYPELLDRVSTPVVDVLPIDRTILADLSRQNSLTCAFRGF